jgi:large subunit ribosomal protein L19
VERIFPISSPYIEEIVVNKRGVVRRARIFYLRERRGKRSRIKEQRQKA